MSDNKVKVHKRISYAKSVLRFAGYGLLGLNIQVAALVLVVAEVLGVLEEVWGA